MPEKNYFKYSNKAFVLDFFTPLQAAYQRVCVLIGECR